MSDFRRYFREAAEQAGVAASAQNAAYVESVESAVDHAWDDLLQVAATYGNNTVDSLKGFVAEVHHAGTYNIDAARLGLDGRHAEVLHSNVRASADLRVHGPSGTQEVQLKYLRTPEDTAKEISRPGYTNMGKIVPADQVAAVKDFAAERAAHDHRPAQAANLQDTAARATDRHVQDGAQSRPLSEVDARNIASDAKRNELEAERLGFTPDQAIQWSDVGREAARGALSAALVTAGIRAAPHVWNVLDAGFSEGRFSVEEFELALAEGLSGAVYGAIKGAVAGAIVTACKSGMLGEAATSLDPVGIGAATAVAISAIGDGMRLARGEITAAEFADRSGRNVVVASAGVVGASIGQTLIPVPVLGAIVGNLVGTVIGTVGYEGTKAAINSLENREGWEAQTSLAAAIADLASTVEIVARRTSTLVLIQSDELSSLRTAGSTWAAQSKQIQRTFSQLSSSGQLIDWRTRLQSERIARLREHSNRERTK